MNMQRRNTFIREVYHALSMAQDIAAAVNSQRKHFARATYTKAISSSSSSMEMSTELD